MNVVNHTGITALVINAIDNAATPIKHIELTRVEIEDFLKNENFKFAEGVGLTGEITNITNRTGDTSGIPTSFRFRNVLIKQVG